ncbi:hypothetical protein [Burkholderia cepacia]|uniref:hypothetical protein n=1 Tax=Burkholderia cepacia TaxID=292 RepID=UPI000AAEBA33|nr:hypothetical protein [Burkholderia cepacia]
MKNKKNVLRCLYIYLRREISRTGWWRVCWLIFVGLCVLVVVKPFSMAVGTDLGVLSNFAGVTLILIGTGVSLLPVFGGVSRKPKAGCDHENESGGRSRPEAASHGRGGGAKTSVLVKEKNNKPHWLIRVRQLVFPDISTKAEVFALKEDLGGVEERLRRQSRRLRRRLAEMKLQQREAARDAKLWAFIAMLLIGTGTLFCGVGLDAILHPPKPASVDDKDRFAETVFVEARLRGAESQILELQTAMSEMSECSTLKTPAKYRACIAKSRALMEFGTKPLQSDGTGLPPARGVPKQDVPKN